MPNPKKKIYRDDFNARPPIWKSWIRHYFKDLYWFIQRADKQVFRGADSI